MVSERDRNIKLIEYIKSLGIDLNIYKNKARGNKGFFSVKNNRYRIDISKNIEKSDLFNVLIHEFAHYLHYTYDKNLTSLDFIFSDFNEEIIEELIELTVETIPKNEAKQIFEQKDAVQKEIRQLENSIKLECPDFENLKFQKEIEKQIQKTELKYLIKNDRVKVFYGFYTKIFSVESLEKDFPSENQVLINYIKLLSKQRFLKRINLRINKLNKYYNSLTELFARAFTLYVTNKEVLELKAPKVLKEFDLAVNSQKIGLFNELLNII